MNIGFKVSSTVIVFAFCASIFIACGGSGSESQTTSFTSSTEGDLSGVWEGVMSPGLSIGFEIKKISGELYVVNAAGWYVATGCLNDHYSWNSGEIRAKIENNEVHIYFDEDIYIGDNRGMELHLYFDSGSKLHGSWVGEIFCQPYIIEGTLFANHCYDNDNDGALFCSFPEGSLKEDDCDDENDKIYLDATEICDGMDNDCNGLIDDTTFAFGEEYENEVLLYPDRDNDGYGDRDSPGKIVCSDELEGVQYVVDNTDCNDSNLDVNPMNDEICRNGIDDNCNGEENEGCQPITLHIPDDFDTIQQAINLASVGDTLLVADGTYYENINFKGKPITLKSVNGPDFSIISGNSDSLFKLPVVTIDSCEDEATTIDGFTITNGFHGIYIGSAASCKHSPFITNCIIKGNGEDTHSASTDSKGGGIYISQSGFPTISNCIIAKNKAFLGGGLYVGGSATIVNATLVSNFAKYNGDFIGDGGGIYYAGSPDSRLTMLNCVIWDNKSGPCAYSFSLKKSVCEKSQFFTTDDGILSVIYSDIEEGFPGIGNIDLNPSLNESYHLNNNSPCIDSGTDDISEYPSLPLFDIDGQDRPRGAGYDMGADEF